MAVINTIEIRAVERRETEASSSQKVVDPLPKVAQALAVLVVLFGLVIIGFVAWRVGKWRRTKARAASQQFNDSLKRETGAASLVHVDLTRAESNDSMDEKVPPMEPYKWRPVTLPAPVHSSNKAVKKGINRFWSMSFSPKSEPSPPAQSPPPTYQITIVPANPPVSPPKITVDANTKSVSRKPVTPTTLNALKVDVRPASPIMPSPIRSASMGPDSPVYKSLQSAPKLQPPQASTGAKTVPRLMVVACTFVPSLADELAIRLGEPLRMLEEYEDEWCLVQRVGKADAERGVVPRFCLQERPEVLPVPKKRVSSNLAQSQFTAPQ